MKTPLAGIPFPTHKAVLGLMGLFDAGTEPLVEEVEGDGRTLLRVTWSGLAVAADRAQYLFLEREDAHLLEVVRRPQALVEAAAILARAFQLRGAVGAWRLERIAELLHGPRDPRRSRARQLVSLRALIALFCRAHFVLDGALDPRRRPRSGAGYGGEGTGPVLQVDEDERGARTVRFGPALATLLEAGKPFELIGPEDFRLARRGVHNPHGNKPSRATRARCRFGAHMFARVRGHQQKPQPLRLERVLRWGGVNTERIGRRRHWETHRRELATELARCHVSVDQGGAARSCLVRFCGERRSLPGRPADDRRGQTEDRRPPAAASASGRPASNGPPAGRSSSARSVKGRRRR